MRCAFGADHAGFVLKDHLRAYVESLGWQTADLGTGSSSSVDYPTFALAVAAEVASGDAERGILVCGTGIGMSIVANKTAGVRAAHCGNEYDAAMARAHNDANVLTLGSRVVGSGLAESIARTFLSTKFEGGRHADRVAMFPALTP